MGSPLSDLLGIMLDLTKDVDFASLTMSHSVPNTPESEVLRESSLSISMFMQAKELNIALKMIQESY